MDWTLVGGLAALTAVIGWMLPSPFQIISRISTLEKDLAVLVNTVNMLRQTVEKLVEYTRQGFGNGDTDRGSGRRTKL